MRLSTDQLTLLAEVKGALWGAFPDLFLEHQFLLQDIIEYHMQEPPDFVAKKIREALASENPVNSIALLIKEESRTAYELGVNRGYRHIQTNNPS